MRTHARTRTHTSAQTIHDENKAGEGFIQSNSHFIFKNSVPLLTCKENHFTKFVGIPTSKTRHQEMQVFFQSIESLSNVCPNVTTPSSSIIPGVMTLTNLLNNNDF